MDNKDKTREELIIELQKKEQELSSLRKSFEINSQDSSIIKQDFYLLNSLMDNLPDYVYFKDKESRFIRINKNHARSFGINDPSEAVGKTDFDFFTKEHAQQAFEDEQAIIKSGKLITVEEKETHPDRPDTWVSTIKAPIYGKDGTIIGTFGVSRDITNKKKREDDFHKLFIRHEAILSAVSEIIIEVDTKNKVVWANSFGLKFFGNDVIGKDAPVFCIEKSNTINDNKLKSDDSGETIYEESWHFRADGRKRLLAWYCRAIYDTKGKITGTIASARDITESKLSEEQINNERRLLRTLIDNLPDTIYVLDNECRKVISNRADLNFIGLANEMDVVGKTDLDLFPGPTGERGHEDNKEVIRTGNPITEKEEDFIDKKGVHRWLRTTKVPLRDKDGNVTGLVGIGIDITTRRQTEEELVRSKEKAEESDRLKSAFIRTISHEIRTPLNSIIGFIALLEDSETDKENQQLYVKTIMQSSDHLLSIITDIITISNIEANTVKPEIEEFNINSTLNYLYYHYTPLAQAKNISITISAPLPDYDSNIFTDFFKLRQILSNLIDNALKFSNSGTINIGYVINRENIKFFVSDSGIGITEKDLEKIFNRFYQIDQKTTRSYDGLGVGLAITKAFVKLLGGRIWVTSQPGKGSTFYFTIPYEKGENMENPAEEMLSYPSYRPTEKWKILVAEDLDSNFKLIKLFLKDTNAEIIRAVNGKEAVDICLNNTDIKLILMDITMQVMDGLTATRILREANITIPIIAQTAYIDDKQTAIDSGCSGFIAKPYDRKKLLQIIYEFV